MVLIKLNNNMYKNTNISILITVYKTEEQVDERLNIRSDTLNLIKEKAGNSLELTGTETTF